MNYSNKIKLLRKEFKLSQSDLASMIGVTQSAVYYWEKGTRNPKLEQIIKICEKTGVSLDYFGYSVITMENGETDICFVGDDKDLFAKSKTQTAFLNYLYSLGCEFIDGSLYDAPYYEVGMIKINNTGVEIPITLEEYEKLETSIEEQVEIELYRLRKKKNI